MTNKNKEIADKAVSEAKEIIKARGSLDESATKILHLSMRTTAIAKQLPMGRIESFMNADYTNLSGEDQYFLGQAVDLVETLSVLLNETVS